MPKPAETLPPDTMVANRYRVRAPLGEGQPGTLYLATQEPLGRHVTLKVLATSPDDPRAPLRFRREAEALSRLSHPACAEVIDFGTWNDLQYMVLRHIPGHALTAAMRRRDAWPPVLALTLCVDLADGLEHAHAVGVVHRNLSPERVVLTEQLGTRTSATLVDFSLAHIGLSELDTTAGHSPIGTPGYLAPERVRGEPGEATADVFAIGVILYELLTAEQPFQRETAAQTLLATTQDAVPPLDRAHPEVFTTPALTRAIQVATAPRAEDRFRDGRELARALRAARLSLLHPALARASFSVVNGETRLDPGFNERMEDPTPPMSPEREALPEPSPEGTSLGIVILVGVGSAIALVLTAGCALAVGLQLAALFI